VQSCEEVDGQIGPAKVTREADSAMKLKRLKINSYRNVRQCDLRFCNGVNILLGPNGAGKTTLLNFISKVLRTGFFNTGDPFSIGIELELSGGSLSGTIEQAKQKPITPKISALKSTARMIRAGSVGKPRPPRLNFEIRLNETRSLSIRSQGERLFIKEKSDDKREQGFELPQEHTITMLLFSIAEVLNDHDWPIKLPRLLGLWRFDEGLDTFRGITARDDDTGLTSYEIRPQLAEFVFSSDSSPVLGIDNGMVADSLLAAMRRRALDGVLDVTFENGELKFLADAVRLMGFRSAEGKIELLERFVRDFSQSTEKCFGNLQFWFTRQDGSIFRDDHLSYGQKRLLSFLYYLDANPSMVIADELVNGMHHVWIEECMSALGDRQAFLTSQNPLLLDYLTFESVEQVKDSIILCRTEIVDGKEEMVWRNLTADEADMFFSAYRVGIEHVGEILRTRGLW
jgi:ABC-type lipoprotein export system ATPase subunit